MGSFSKAQRKKAMLRLAIDGGPGQGKTYSALEIAKGIVSMLHPELTPEAAMAGVFMVDTERGSGELYADKGDYNVGSLDVSFDPMQYVSKIKEAEAAGAEVIIVDSLTHAWSGSGGALEQVDNRSAQGGNKYTAWRDVTPKHNALVDAILQCKAHVICTMRTKVEYVLEPNDKGKMVPRKVGLKPVQREGMEYEFTVVMDMADNHMATVSKDRTSLLDGKVFQPTQETGRQLLGWLNSGVDAPPPPAQVEPQAPAPAPEQAPPPVQDGPPLGQAFDKLQDLKRKIAGAKDKATLGAVWQEIIDARNQNLIGIETAEELKAECRTMGASLGA